MRARGFLPAAAGAAAFALAVLAGAPAWHARRADALYAGDADAQRALARGARWWTERDLERSDFMTGSPRFDGEWLFATSMMTAMGLGQTALEHPRWKAEHGRAMARAIDRLLRPELRVFDREAWDGHDALDDVLASDRPHVAYLGYLSLAMSLHQVVDRRSRHAALNGRILAHLERLAAESPTALLETYPGEVYPIDNSAFIGSLGLHARATGTDHRATLERALRALHRDHTDRASGLLYQRIDRDTGRPEDRPRASGTALAVYFLGFVCAGEEIRHRGPCVNAPDVSRALWRALRAQVGGPGGLGMTREYPPGEEGGGDVDSGPVVLGYGVSATGFSIGGARIHGDREAYRRALATASFFGAPIERDGRLHWALGGPMGDALLFAMLTAQPAARWRSR
jgi:hypothetical protein